MFNVSIVGHGALQAISMIVQRRSAWNTTLGVPKHWDGLKNGKEYFAVAVFIFAFAAGIVALQQEYDRFTFHGHLTGWRLSCILRRHSLRR
jgi:hypothetical protein